MFGPLYGAAYFFGRKRNAAHGAAKDTPAWTDGVIKEAFLKAWLTLRVNGAALQYDTSKRLGSPIPFPTNERTKRVMIV